MITEMTNKEDTPKEGYQEIKTSLFVKNRIFHRTYDGSYIAMSPDGMAERFDLALLKNIVSEGKGKANSKGVKYGNIGVVMPFHTSWQSSFATRDDNLANAICYLDGLMKYEENLRNDYH